MLKRFLQRVQQRFLMVALVVYEFSPFQSKYTGLGYKRLILILFTFIEIEINFCIEQIELIMLIYLISTFYEIILMQMRFYC